MGTDAVNEVVADASAMDRGVGGFGRPEVEVGQLADKTFLGSVVVVAAVE